MPRVAIRSHVYRTGPDKWLESSCKNPPALSIEEEDIALLASHRRTQPVLRTGWPARTLARFRYGIRHTSDEEQVRNSPFLSDGNYTVWFHEESAEGVPHPHAAICCTDEVSSINNDHLIQLRTQRTAEQVVKSVV